jgi:hypothetical protein
MLAVNEAPAANESFATAEVTTEADDPVNKDIQIAHGHDKSAPQQHDRSMYRSCVWLFPLFVLSVESTREPNVLVRLAELGRQTNTQKNPRQPELRAGSDGERCRAVLLPRPTPLMPRSHRSRQIFMVDSEGMIHRKFQKNSACSQLFWGIRATLRRICAMRAQCSRIAQQHSQIAGWNYALRAKSPHFASLPRVYTICVIERDLLHRQSRLPLQLSARDNLRYLVPSY